MATREITFVKGDSAEPLISTLKSRGVIKDLTLATVVLIIRDPDGNVTNLPCEVIDPGTSGRVQHVWDEDNLPASGRYQAEHHVTYQNGKEQTFPSRKPNTLIIRNSLS